MYGIWACGAYVENEEKVLDWYREDMYYTIVGSDVFQPIKRAEDN